MDFLGRVLEVGVYGDDGVALRALEASDYRRVLPEIAVEIYYPDDVGTLLPVLAKEFSGGVAAAVVHEDGLPRPSDFVHGFAEPFEEGGEIALLVVDGDYYRYFHNLLVVVCVGDG